jgi:hypothetical protein
VATLFTAVWCSTALTPIPAAAVLLDFGDGTGNTTAPLDDPGWEHVGKRSNLNVVYLRNGWVLTANHVGVGSVLLDGVVYSDVPNTAVRLSNGNGTKPDLKVFAITPLPPLTEMPIRSNTSLPTGEVIMIGRGVGRGSPSDSDDPLIWEGPEPNPNPPIMGYFWESGSAKRWGENKVEDYWPGDPLNTATFFTVFDPPGEPEYLTYEAQAAIGDSGGALFVKDNGSWELAGIMFIVGDYSGQFVNENSLYGNVTGCVDLSVYRDEIMSLTTTFVPEPSSVLQLTIGGAFLALLRRRKQAR